MNNGTSKGWNNGILDAHIVIGRTNMAAVRHCHLALILRYYKAFWLHIAIMKKIGN